MFSNINKNFQNGHKIIFIINTKNYFAKSQAGLFRNVIVNNSHWPRMKEK